MIVWLCALPSLLDKIPITEETPSVAELITLVPHLLTILTTVLMPLLMEEEESVDHIVKHIVPWVSTNATLTLDTTLWEPLLYPLHNIARMCAPYSLLDQILTEIPVEPLLDADYTTLKPLFLTMIQQLTAHTPHQLEEELVELSVKLTAKLSTLLAHLLTLNTLPTLLVMIIVLIIWKLNI